MKKKFIYCRGDETPKDVVAWKKYAIGEINMHGTCSKSYSSEAMAFLKLLDENSRNDSSTQVILHEKETELRKLQKELQEEMEKVD